MTEHCWHSTNIVLDSYPEQYPEVCCNCGGKRTRSWRAVSVPGHGPHVDPIESSETIYWGGEEPCVPTEPE